MENQNILEILKSVNAIITDDHFVLTSGLHSSTYINKDALYPHTMQASKIGRLFAEHAKNLDIDAVAAPALGGIVLSQWTAYHLSDLLNKDVLGVYTEKTLEKNQIFTRGYDKMIRDKNVFVIEDLTTTGNSVKKVIDSVKKHGGNVVSVGVMLNRDPENVNKNTIDKSFFSLSDFHVESYESSNCPMCRQNKPINTSVGHGKKYLESLKG